MMSKLTRRGAVMVILTGVVGVAIDTDAFTSSEAERDTNVGVGAQSALLGINSEDVGDVFDVSAEPHEIGVTNQTESQLEITVESQTDKSRYTFGTVKGEVGADSITIPEDNQFLAPGNSTDEGSSGIFVSTDNTGTVTETIEFKATSKSESVGVQTVKQISLKNDPGLIAGCSNIEEFPKQKGNKPPKNPNGSVKIKQGTILEDDSIKAGDCVILAPQSEVQTDTEGLASASNVILREQSAITDSGIPGVSGSVELGKEAEINGQAGSGDNPIGGNLTLKKDSKIIDSGVKVKGNVEVGPQATIGGQVGSGDTPVGGNLALKKDSKIIDSGVKVEGDVELGEGAEIGGKVGSSDTPVGGNLTLEDGSVIKGDVFVEGDVTNNGGSINGDVNPSG